MREFSWSSLMQAARRGDALGIRFGADPAYVADVIGTGGFVYLATPYSKRVKDRLGHWELGLSARVAAEAAVEVGRLKDAGVSAFSPIALSADVVHATLQMRIRAEPVPRHDPLDAEAWLRWCMPFLTAARAVVVPDLMGWDQSHGIREEVLAAVEIKLPVILYAGLDGAEAGQ